MPPARRSRAHIAGAVGLFVSVVAVYVPSLGADFLYDDHEVIVAQTAPRSLGDLLAVFGEPHFRGLPYYRPITRATLLAQKALHGDRPALFRLGNALLMGVAALLAFALLRTPALGIAREPALLAAALFALHPVASSTVYPIASGRETLLPGVLMLASAVAWLRAHRGLATLALLAALFAKEQAVVLPALLLLADSCGVAAEAPRLERAALAAWTRRYAGVALAVACYLAARLSVLPAGGIVLALPEAPLGPLWSYLFALQTAFAPFARLVYEPELAIWLSGPRLLLAAGGIGGLALLTRRLGAPGPRVALFLAGWFLLAQLPSAQILRQEAPHAERWTWLSWLAIPAWAAAAVSAGWMRSRVRRATRVAGAVLLAAAVALTLLRAADFHDDVAFATRWLETNPTSPDAHHLLGVVYLRAGRLRDAMYHLRLALAGSRRAADIHANLGAALAMQGRSAEALAELEAALAMAPDHPEANTNLGLLLARDGRYAEAVAHYRTALAAAPRSPAIHGSLATALERMGQRDEAATHWAEALRLEPGNRDAARALARLQAEP